MSEWMGGKGSKPRPVNKKRFDENWDRIFGSKSSDDKCNSCKKGYNGTNGNGYQPCGCKKG